MKPSPHSSALLLVVLLGCDAAQPPLAVRSDTALVEPMADSAPVVAVTESTAVVWRIGGFQPNPDDEISSNHGVMGLVALPGGRYLLSEGSRVRVFDAAGTERWRFGRDGAGPEEFRSLGWPCAIRGDTVVVMDQRNQRFAILDAGRGLIRTIPVDRRSLREGDCSGDGLFMVERTVNDSVTDARHTVNDLLNSEGDMVSSIPGGPPASYSVVGEGETATSLVDTLVFTANPNSGEIRLMTRDGNFFRTLRWGVPRIPVTDENIPDRYGATPRDASAEQLEAWWDRVRGMRRARNWPAFVQVRADGADRLWIREDSDDDAPTVDWWVVGLDGLLRAKVQFPRSTREHRVQLLGFVPDGIVFYSEDADGAPWVSVVGYPAELGR